MYPINPTPWTAELARTSPPPDTGPNAVPGARPLPTPGSLSTLHEGLRRRTTLGADTLQPRSTALPGQLQTTRGLELLAPAQLKRRDVVIQIDPEPAQDPGGAGPSHHPAERPAPFLGGAPPDHVVIDIDDLPELPPAPPGSQPSFMEALNARIMGALPPQLLHAGTDLVLSMIEAAGMGTSVVGAAAHAGVQAGLNLGLGTAFHVGMTGVLQARPSSLSTPGVTKEETLQRIRTFSAMLSMPGTLLANPGMAKAASMLLKQPAAMAKAGFAILNGMVATGVVTGGAMLLYKTNPTFRKEVDEQIQFLIEKLYSFMGQSPVAIPPYPQHDIESPAPAAAPPAAEPGA